MTGEAAGGIDRGWSGHERSGGERACRRLDARPLPPHAEARDAAGGGGTLADLPRHQGATARATAAAGRLRGLGAVELLGGPARPLHALAVVYIARVAAVSLLFHASPCDASLARRGARLEGRIRLCVVGRRTEVDNKNR